MNESLSTNQNRNQVALPYVKPMIETIKMETEGVIASSIESAHDNGGYPGSRR